MTCEHAIYYKCIHWKCDEQGHVHDENDEGVGCGIGDEREDNCPDCKGDCTVYKVTWRCGKCKEDLG